MSDLCDLYILMDITGHYICRIHVDRWQLWTPSTLIHILRDQTFIRDDSGRDFTEVVDPWTYDYGAAV